MPAGTLGRRVVNVTQKARGRTPLNYEFEIIPYTAWDIPTEHERLLFAWERGSKIFVTEAERVRPNGAVFWKQFLKQTVTMYRGPNGFEAKDYSFKLQTVKARGKGEDERKTVAKIHIDLSVYCTGQIDPQPVEKTLHLKPFGKLKVSIRASWLKDSKIEQDAMTEMTSTTMFTDSQEQEEEEEEQDLSGFENGEPSSSRPGYRDTGENGEDAQRRSRRHRKSKKKSSKGRDLAGLPDGIPEGTESYDNEPMFSEPVREKRRPRKRQQDEDYPTDGNTDQGQGDLEMGTHLQVKTWRDYLCGCCAPRAETGQADAHEEQDLLSTTQKTKTSSKSQNSR